MNQCKNLLTNLTYYIFSWPLKNGIRKLYWVNKMSKSWPHNLFSKQYYHTLSLIALVFILKVDLGTNCISIHFLSFSHSHPYQTQDPSKSCFHRHMELHRNIYKTCTKIAKALLLCSLLKCRELPYICTFRGCICSAAEKSIFKWTQC